MRQNVITETVAEGRYPTLSSIKMSPNKTDVNIGIKRLEADQVNQYSAMRAPINCNQRNPSSTGDLTSYKNNLPPENTYFDPAILQSRISKIRLHKVFIHGHDRSYV